MFTRTLSTLIVSALLLAGIAGSAQADSAGKAAQKGEPAKKGEKSNEPTVAVEVKLIAVPEDICKRLPEDAPADKTSCRILSEIQVRLLMEAIQSSGKSNVMQAPMVEAKSKSTGKIEVLDHQLFVTDFRVTTNDKGTSVMPVQVDYPTGLRLEVCPVVSADRGSIELKLKGPYTWLASNEVLRFPVKIHVQAEQGSGKAPITITQHFQQPCYRKLDLGRSLTIPTGATAFFEAGKRWVEDRQEEGIPILSDIPYVNRLFCNTRYERRVEKLLVLVTPRIVQAEQAAAKQE